MSMNELKGEKEIIGHLVTYQGWSHYKSGRLRKGLDMKSPPMRNIEATITVEVGGV